MDIDWGQLEFDEKFRSQVISKFTALVNEDDFADEHRVVNLNHYHGTYCVYKKTEKGEKEIFTLDPGSSDSPGYHKLQIPGITQGDGFCFFHGEAKKIYKKLSIVSEAQENEEKRLSQTQQAVEKTNNTIMAQQKLDSLLAR